MQKTLNIWKFTDGKQGHISQSDGLIAAIRKSRDVVESVVDANEMPSAFAMFFRWLFRKRPAIFPNNTPDFIIGAGHRTHASILLANALCGGKTIVLMKPSLPLKRFDFVVVPRHDHVRLRANVIETQGALNAVPFVSEKDMNTGIILIGGESKHYVWDSERIAMQIKQIVQQEASVSWTLTTSRRTPKLFLQLLSGLTLEMIPFEKTDEDWLLEKYKSSGKIWVTPDSVSMVYESLSSGAVTNVFSLVPSDTKSRVRSGLEELLENKSLLSFEDWEQEIERPLLQCEFDESTRVAKIVLNDII